jgi:hypothetical protein
MLDYDRRAEAFLTKTDTHFEAKLVGQGITRPSADGSKELWRTAQAKHSAIGCQDCKARAKTRLANTRRKERDQVMRDLGLVKVRGALGGVYWE